MQPKIPCENCIVYAICQSRSAIHCRLVDKYVFDYMNVAGQIGWRLDLEKLNQVLYKFNTTGYSSSYEYGRLIFHPRLRANASPLPMH